MSMEHMESDSSNENTEISREYTCNSDKNEKDIECTGQATPCSETTAENANLGSILYENQSSPQAGSFESVHNISTGVEKLNQGLDFPDGNYDTLGKVKSGVNLYDSVDEFEMRKRKGNNERSSEEVSHIRDVEPNDSRKIFKKPRGNIIHKIYNFNL